MTSADVFDGASRTRAGGPSDGEAGERRRPSKNPLARIDGDSGDRAYGENTAAEIRGAGMMGYGENVGAAIATTVAATAPTRADRCGV